MTPPSTRRSLSYGTGGMRPGMEMLARTAVASGPRRCTTPSPGQAGRDAEVRQPEVLDAQLTQRGAQRVDDPPALITDATGRV